MRIVLLGQAAFAQQALEALVSHGEEIVHVFVPPDPPSGRPDPLKAKALELRLPVSQPASFRSDTAYQQFMALDADLAILAFVTLIVPERILHAPRYKTICFHPSLLPRHRGASAINWSIIQGDAESGITWFWPDQGIDTGPILLQRRVAIGPDDTTGSLYFNTLFPLGIQTMIEAVELIRSGRAPSIPQDEKLATYEPPCRDEHGRVNFAKSAREVYNLVRGCDPQPGAYAEFDGKRVRLFDAALDAPVAPHAPAGTVAGIDERGMRIALEGATLVVRRARIDPSPKKVAPAELAASGEIKVGARLQ